MKPTTINSTRRDLLIAGAAFVTAAALPSVTWGASSRMKIGLIGAGRIGSTLGRLWASAGYPVMLSARDLGPVKALVAQIGHDARAGTPAEAAAFGDVILISVPYAALPQVGRDYAAQLKGKVVLDTCNPNKRRDGDMANEALEKGTGVVDPTYLLGTRLVRAFNTVNFRSLASEAHRSGELVGIPLAADDQEALRIAKQLVTDAGFEPVVVGGLSTAKSFDTGTSIYGKALAASAVRTALGVQSP